MDSSKENRSRVIHYRRRRNGHQSQNIQNLCSLHSIQPQQTIHSPPTAVVPGLSNKVVNFILYQPVRLEFVVSVSQSVPNHPLKRTTQNTGLCRTYRQILDILAGK